MTPLATSGPERVFHFAGTQDGELFFRGVCEALSRDDQRITLGRRSHRIYSFEPGDRQPRCEIVPLGSITLKLSDFNLLVTDGPPSVHGLGS